MRTNSITRLDEQCEIEKSLIGWILERDAKIVTSLWKLEFVADVFMIL